MIYRIRYDLIQLHFKRADYFARGVMPCHMRAVINAKGRLTKYVLVICAKKNELLVINDTTGGNFF